jgi:flavin-dependent dehydrogenase
LKIHVHGLELVRALEVHLGDQAYVGLSGVENGRVNLCGLFRRRKLSAPGAALILAYLEAAGLASLVARIRQAALDDDSFCAVAAVSFDQRVPRTDTVTLGDACAMVPPFTGNGMAMAFQSAEIALDPLLAYVAGTSDWRETCRNIHTALRRRFRLRLASAHLLHPYLLRPSRQRWLAALNRVHLLPFRPLYTALH